MERFCAAGELAICYALSPPLCKVAAAPLARDTYIAQIQTHDVSYTGSRPSEVSSEVS